MSFNTADTWRSVAGRPASRFLSELECAALLKRATQLAVGGGETDIKIESRWSGYIRYARNEVFRSGDVRDNDVHLLRNIRGAFGLMLCNQIDDIGLQSAIRRAEHLLRLRSETGGEAFSEHYVMPPQDTLRTIEDVRKFIDDEDRHAAMNSLIQVEEPYEKPHILFDSTYNLDATQRVNVVAPLLDAAKSAGLMAAGFIRVSAHGRSVMNTWGRSLYYPYTLAEYSVTVRDPEHNASGWAGVDWSDWTRIDTKALTEIAIEKCIQSRDPVAVEPGRYTVVLEPQAVSDISRFVVGSLERELAESGTGPFSAPKGRSKIGQHVIDERISITADAMDPDLGFPPFSFSGNVYHPVTWIEHGVLKELAYFRPYGIRVLGKNSGLPNSQAFHMSGGTATIPELIATTKRGLLVTRFSNVHVIDAGSLLCTGYTRDGLWLIENGKIVKPVKNFRFTESPLFMLNNVEELGVPQRVFHPGTPMVVPPIKARDFNFSSLSEAV